MAVVSLAELKEQLAITPDLGTADDALLGRLLLVAEGHIGRLLGYGLEAAVVAATEGFEDGVPEELRHAVLMLAAHLYANREAAADLEVREVPFGVREIVEGWRGWTF